MRVFPTDDSMSRASGAPISPTRINRCRSRALRGRLNPRMRSSWRTSASLRARRSIGGVPETCGSFR